MDIKITEKMSRQFAEACCRGEYYRVRGMMHPDGQVGGIVWSEEEWNRAGELLKKLQVRLMTQKYQLVYWDTKTALVDGDCLVERGGSGHSVVHRLSSMFLWEWFNRDWKLRCLKVEEKRDGHICIRSVAGEEYFIRKYNICYVEAIQSKTQVHCFGEIITARIPMEALLRELSGKFMRIHRSFVVNTDYVSGIHRYEIYLQDGTRLPVPEKKYKRIKEEIRIQKELYRQAGV